MSDYTAIKQLLQNKLHELVVRIEGIDSDLRQPGDDDWEERAAEQESDEVLAAVGNLSVAEIDQIRHALHQIENGTYGKCERCGVRIPKARLEALPFATTCTGCA